MSNEVGIKELTDIIEALKGLAVSGIIASKDGIGLEDFSVLTENLGLLKEALSGITKVPEELKDLSTEEIVALCKLGVDLVSEIINAIKDTK